MSLIATLERIANALEESEQDQRNRIVALRVTSDVTSLAEMFLRQIRDGNPLAMGPRYDSPKRCLPHLM